MSVEVYRRGATIGLWAHFKTWAGVAYSPDQGVKVTLYNPSQVKKVDDLPMAEDETGNFVYWYNSATDDELGTNWWYEAVGQDGTGDNIKYTRKTGSFELK